MARRARESSLIIVGAAAAAMLAACSSSPRFTSHPGREPEPVVHSTPTSEDSAHRTLPPEETAGRALSPQDSARRESGASEDSLGSEVVKRAENYLGAPYRSGGTTARGVDCSGLTCAVYEAVGIQLPRTSDEQAHIGTPVSEEELRAGDLIFFGYGHNVSHVGIYTGDGEFIHASTHAHRVRYDRLDNKYFRNRYVTARRVL